LLDVVLRSLGGDGLVLPFHHRPVPPKPHHGLARIEVKCRQRDVGVPLFQPFDLLDLGVDPRLVAVHRVHRHAEPMTDRTVGDRDEETVNAALIAKILGNDWGFWRTVSGNLKILDERLDQYEALSPEDGQVVRSRIHQLQECIEAAPKTLKWKARARIGEKMKWYKSVEELQR